MGRTACTAPQCLYKSALYLFFTVLLSERNVVQYLMFGCTVPITDHYLRFVGFQLLGCNITTY